MVTPLHNCIQTNLENQYYREKLTDFYKENRNLKEQLNILISKKEDPKSTPKNEVSIQTGDYIETPKNIPKIQISSSTTSKLQKTINSTYCSVCARPSSKYNESNIQTQTNKVTTGSNTCDDDMYNKQNKVSFNKGFSDTIIF